MMSSKAIITVHDVAPLASVQIKVKKGMNLEVLAVSCFSMNELFVL